MYTYVGVKVRKKVRLQLILFSKITGAFLFRIFLHVLTTLIYCLTGAIISETHITNIMYI